jgi:ferric-dicitrate binding protein FerR (iron transport regulator)
MLAYQSKPGATSVSDATFAEASRWHARLREPDADAQTHTAFQDWLTADPPISRPMSRPIACGRPQASARNARAMKPPSRR